MKKYRHSLAALLAAFLMVAALCGCGGESGTVSAGTDELTDVANDYYFDLTDLGMKLTLYLRLGEDGAFLFSNTPAFEVNKSAGTYQKTDEGYLMVYTSVNGEEKSISDGLTSSFVVTEDGALDFTGCERVYYGSASATTVSAEHPDAKLVGYVIPPDYEAPSQESDFRAGTYSAVTEDGAISYTHTASFFEDGTYLLITVWSEDNTWMFSSETGSYGVSTTQLALEPEGGSRLSCEIVGAEELSLSILPEPDAAERESVTFTVSEAELLAAFSGEGRVTGSDETFTGTMELYSDGSFSVTADSFGETGVIALNSAGGTCKIYPDHPAEGTRGLSQVSAVPSGALEYEGGMLVFPDMRVRTSESLNRDKCTFTQIMEGES